MEQSQAEPVGVGERFRRLPPFDADMYVRIEIVHDAYGRVNARNVATGQLVWVNPSMMVPLFKRSEIDG